MTLDVYSFLNTELEIFRNVLLMNLGKHLYLQLLDELYRVYILNSPVVLFITFLSILIGT